MCIMHHLKEKKGYKVYLLKKENSTPYILKKSYQKGKEWQEESKKKTEKLLKIGSKYSEI